MQSTYEQDRAFQQEQKPIKIEPRDKTSPHQISTSPLHVYPPYGDQNWAVNMDQMQGNLGMPGPSHQNPFPDMTWGGAYGQNLTPLAPTNLQPLSPPNMQVPSPHHQLLSPNMQVVPNMAHSPMHRVVSPMGQSIHDVGSPMGQSMHGCASPMGQSMHGGASPMGQSMHGGASPMGQSMHGGASPMGHSMHGTTSPMGQPMQGAVSPNLVQHTDYTQESGTGTSLSALLERGDGAALSSSELLNLSALLADRGPDLLSTDLNRLSTNDMLF